MKIKICGLFREEDIEYVNIAMPDYIGFIIDFPKSHRSITIEKARLLKNKLDPKIQAVGVFVDAPYDAIIKFCEENIIDMVQLHGNESDDYINTLKQLVNRKTIKAFIVDNKFDYLIAENSPADYILLDGGMGSGKSFSYKEINNIKRPLFLAGGLSTENIRNSIKSVHPFAVDISTGVETNKFKDFEKIITAVKIVHEEEK